MKKKLNLFEEEVLRRLAVDYYENRMSHKQIADKAGISRQAVSSALDRARDLGIVQCVVIPEARPARLPKIQRQVMRKFGLTYAEIVPTHIDEQGLPTPDVIPSIARAAAYIDDELTNESCLALSGGNQFIRQVISNLSPQEALPEMEVLPLSGFMGAQADLGSAPILAYDTATLYGARYYWLPIPAVVETDEQRQLARQLPIVRDTLQKIDERANIFLMTLFTPISDLVENRSVVRREQLQAILAHAPACNIELWYLTADGSCINQRFDSPPFFLTGYDINRLRDKVARTEAQVILVAGAHAGHVAGIRSVLNAGLANVLITDHVTAMTLCNA